MKLSFSMASINEAPDIVKLVNSAYRGEPSKTGWTTEADLLDGQRTDYDQIIHAIEEPFSSIVVAKNVHNQIVACCEIKIIPQDYFFSKHTQLTIGNRNLYFGMFTVTPDLQNSGLGKQVLTHIEGLATKWGLDKIQMSVITQRKELIDFYLRRGFSLLPHLIDFPSDPKFGVPKVENLKMIILEKKIKTTL
ncbi:MAG: GNAT family N-acetyltransferase [Bdellovibrionaceae bacterium]|nr:GNAT family N-acetyltransferase [Pseudobdellovibrionaceae bacterium]